MTEFSRDLDAGSISDAALDLPPAADTPATELTIPDGIAAEDDTEVVQAANTEGDFGELATSAQAPDETVDAADELFAEDRDPVDTTSDDQNAAVTNARRQVAAALDETDHAADNAGAGNGDHDTPSGGSGGNRGNGGDNEHGDYDETGDEGGKGGDDEADDVGSENDDLQGTVENAEPDEDSGRIEIPAQQVEEEAALVRMHDQAQATTETDEEASEMSEAEAARIRDEAHDANLTDLKHLATITTVSNSAGGGRFDNLRFELTHNGQDASEYLAELASELRTGSSDMPRLSNWREELTGPEALRPGQVIEVATLRDLDELLARVGGWLNNDIRATRGSGALPEPHTGQWQDPRHKPSDLLGDVRDLRGKHFFGAQTNIEAMPLPAIRGHAEHTRYFTVSSQLKSTGKPAEPSRPMRLVSVSALPIGYKSDRIQSRFAEIGRVPASVSAWLIDSQSRQIGHDVEYEARANPYTNSVGSHDRKITKYRINLR